MSWVFVVLAAVAGAVLLWVLVDPRGQWRVLVGWATRDPAAAEPGDAIHGLRRVIAGLGLAGLLAVVGVAAFGQFASQPRPPLPSSALQQMWGTPVPRLLDRIVPTHPEEYPQLAPATIVGAQEITPGRGPRYLLDMPRWSRLGDRTPSGILGSDAPSDATGYGGASLLLSVRGPLMCIPRAVTVQEGEDEVRVAVWFGLPDPADGSEPDHLAGCPGNPNADERILIPIPLSAELGDRVLTALDGAPIVMVPTPDS